MADDPFAILGLGRDTTVEAVRDARRRLALEHHPDRGGDPATMRALNEAADAAIRLLEQERPAIEEARPESPDVEPSRMARDVPSFTVEALPAETFEALLIVAATLGDVLDDDPPYRLDTYLRPPLDCWCRLDVLPDAGASTVSITIAGIDGEPAPDILAVRDAWVADLNQLDWPD